MRALSTRHKLRLASLKIKTQFPPTPQARLCHAIIDRALMDLVERRHKLSDAIEFPYRDEAYRYLQNDMPAAEACGVDSGWIRLILKKIGVFDDIEGAGNCQIKP